MSISLKPRVENRYRLNDSYKRDHRYYFIGRPSKFGNPFVINSDGTREEVVQKFKDYLMSKPSLLEAARKELKGKVLVCYCAPKMCHGDVLLEIANAE
jgi:hypothetical protein